MRSSLRPLLCVAFLLVAGCEEREPVYGLVYLQTVAQDYATVMYESAQPAPSRVALCHLPQDGGPPTVSAVEDPERTTRHSVLLQGLDSEGSYRYLVVPEEERGVRPSGPDPCFSVDGWFARSPVDGPFTFAALGDTHGNGDAMNSLLPFAVEADFLVHTGDALSAAADTASWPLDFFLPGKTFFHSLPVYSALGNHDGDREGFLRYHSYPGGRSYYAFSHSQARFIVLDTSLDYLPGSEQHDWLCRELASVEATEASWRVVVFHEPPYSEGWSDCDRFDGDHTVREVLVPKLEESGVDLVLNGHVHGYERGRLNGVTYVTTGGGGGALDHFCRDVPHLVVSRYVDHVVLVEVSAGELVVSAYGLERQLIDTFVLE